MKTFQGYVCKSLSRDTYHGAGSWWCAKWSTPQGGTLAVVLTSITGTMQWQAPIESVANRVCSRFEWSFHCIDNNWICSKRCLWNIQRERFSAVMGQRSINLVTNGVCSWFERRLQCVEFQDNLDLADNKLVLLKTIHCWTLKTYKHLAYVICTRLHVKSNQDLGILTLSPSLGVDCRNYQILWH